jgi:hypothetical protein
MCLAHLHSLSRFGLIALFLATTASPALAQTIWVEGEKPVRSTMNRHPWWYDQVKKDQLSGGDWISNFSEEKEGEAEYVIEVAKTAVYRFWIRANPIQAKLDYALDRDSWKPIDMSSDVLDTVNIAADGKPDLRFLAWKKVNEINLSRGRHTVRFRFYSKPQHHGALDALVFTTEPFLPSGTQKPGQGGPLTKASGTWPFQPERDTFRPDALFDLRGLNENVAGQSGFVRLAADGESFVLGDGSPVRFWGVTTFVQRDRSLDDLAHHARFLAKRGVNMVRLHGHLEPKDKNSRLTDVDDKTIEEAWKLVAAMKKEGIYVTLSPYWSANVKHVPAQWGIDGWPENESPFGLLFFNPTLQAAYKSWLKALLARPNPHTGIALAQDPAVAIIQLQNEDSLLFWTSQNVKGKQAELLGRQFGDWLKTKYGSLAAAFKRWGNDVVPEDKPAQGVVGLLLVWEWTQKREGGRKRRLDDQLEFYAQTMYRFNRETERYLRDELGCKQLVNAGNWRTADAARLDDAERWSYTANEVIAVNRYYSPVHLGPDRGWRIGPGDQFEDVSVLTRPRELPLNLKQVAGHPMAITESHWVPPLGYQSEGPFLVAAYQSLSGVDVFYWFSTGETEWSNQDRAPWDSASRSKWSIATPMILGQFPATALLFRKGYLAQGRPVVAEHRSMRQIWERSLPVLAEDPGYDPNRDGGDVAHRSDRHGVADPLAFLVGPVKVQYDSNPAETKVADLRRFVDAGRQIITSNTGEIRFDYGRGLCVIDAPCAQGSCGFLNKAGAIDLSAVTISSTNDYASVLVVSQDSAPLTKSRRVLVQVGTRARPSDWVEREATFTGDDSKQTFHGKQVVSTGRMPWVIDETRVSLSIRNPSLKRATLVDVNGNSRGTVSAQVTGSGVKLVLPCDSMYVVISDL